MHESTQRTEYRERIAITLLQVAMFCGRSDREGFGDRAKTSRSIF
jgi:hypothetical protein